MLAQIRKVITSSVIYLIVFDVIGVVVSFVFDVAPLRFKSGLLFYAIWFVLGVFCGMLTYNSAGQAVCEAGDGDWSGRPDAARAGRLVVAVMVGLLATFSVLSYFVWWSRGVEWMYFVPDNMSLTLVFFGTILASAVLAHSVLRPTPSK